VGRAKLDRYAAEVIALCAGNSIAGLRDRP